MEQAFPTQTTLSTVSALCCLCMQLAEEKSSILG